MKSLIAVPPMSCCVATGWNWLRSWCHSESCGSALFQSSAFLDALLIGGAAALGKVDHAGVIGHMKSGIQVKDIAVDFSTHRGGQVSHRRADFLGSGQVADAFREVGAAVPGLDFPFVGRV